MGKIVEESGQSLAVESQSSDEGPDVESFDQVDPYTAYRESQIAEHRENQGPCRPTDKANMAQSILGDAFDLEGYPF